MTIRVECYAGYRCDEEPRRFEIDGRIVEVAAQSQTDKLLTRS